MPDLTQRQIDFINKETKAEEERIERLRNPTFLQDLYDSFQTSNELFDIDFEWAPGLKCRYLYSLEIEISNVPEKLKIFPGINIAIT